MGHVRVIKVAGGLLETNMYVLYSEEASVVIDAGDEASELVRVLRDLNLEPKALLVTHGHADHYLGSSTLKKAFPNLKVYMSPLDLDVAALTVGLIYPELAERGLGAPEVDEVVAEGLYEFGDVVVEAISTPGHSPGSVSFYVPGAGAVFTGDTLFAGSVGRTDLVGGSFEELLNSICKLYNKLPHHVRVMPGHGPETTLGLELRTNPYVGYALARCGTP